MNNRKIIFQKIWDSHVVASPPTSPEILYIDLHLIHEVTSPQAFDGLRANGHKVRRPDRTIATMDHSTPTKTLSLSTVDQMAARQLNQLAENCKQFGIKLYDLQDPERGIVHVIGPELGLTLPGMTIVCGDSHTATHGAFGALAFGIGTSEVQHVLATQCLLQSRPKTMLVTFTGQLQKGVTAKDMILYLIAQIGAGGGTGYVFEYSGTAVQHLDMESRMTLCNMSIEAGARAGMISPDDTTFEYLHGRQFAPKEQSWDTWIEKWRSLPTPQDGVFDKSISIDAAAIKPIVTYGTNPGMNVPVDAPIPDPEVEFDGSQKEAVEKSLKYMSLTPGQFLSDQQLDVIFIGSCTNGRLTDLRQAAAILKDRKIAEGVALLVVPGSEQVRRQAESEGLDKIFTQAGGDWRYSGCSMCIAMNGDSLKPGQYALSTSNRNFEGRQGIGGRTFLASPLTAAASAVHGRITDPRTMI